ncbi:MAG: hypothetical protein ACKO3P_12040 [Planctomycetaceae bacterium]
MGLDSAESETKAEGRRRSRKRVRVKVKAGAGWSQSWPLAVGLLGVLLGVCAVLLRWLPGLTLPSFLLAWLGFVGSLIALGVRSMRSQPIRQPAMGVGVCAAAILLELILQKTLPPELANPRSFRGNSWLAGGRSDLDPNADSGSKADGLDPVDLLEKAIRKDREDAIRFERSLPSLKNWKMEATPAVVVDRIDSAEAVAALNRRELELEFDALEIEGEARRTVVGVKRPNAPVTDSFLQEIAPHLAGLPNLRQLEFPLGLVTAESLSQLEPSPALRSLLLPRASDAALAELVRFPNLESLEFTDRDTVTDAGLEAVANFNRLVTLDLGLAPRRSKGLTDAGLARLAPLAALQTLKIPNAAITGSGLAGELFLVRLRRLDLSSCDLDDTKLPLIGKFKALEDLRLRRNLITGTGLGALRECTRLRRLDLSQTETLKSVNLSLLIGLPVLEELLLAECPLEEGVARVLPKFQSLKVLDLTTTPLPPAVCTRIQNDLPECRVVFGVDIR